MRAQTEMTTFSCKDDWGKFLHVCWSGGKGLVKNQDRARPELTQPLLCLLSCNEQPFVFYCLHECPRLFKVALECFWNLLSVIRLTQSLKKLEMCFKKVSRLMNGVFMDAYGKFQGSLRVSIKFCKCVSNNVSSQWRFRGCLKTVSRNIGLYLPLSKDVWDWT